MLLNIRECPLRINMYIKYFFIKEMLRKYTNIIQHSAICIITTPNNDKIRYLDIYLKHLINIEDFFKLCLEFKDIRHSINDNIKMRNTDHNEIIYTLKEEFKKSERDGKILRKYSKINF